MRYIALSIVFLAALLVYGCAEQITSSEVVDGSSPSASGDAAQSTAGKNGLPMAVTVQFGRLDLGTDFPPAQHDRSFHAEDKIHPRTTVIATGGTVTFEVAPPHYPAIYEPGIDPEDISTEEIEEEEGCPIPVFEDEDGRIAEGPLNCPSTEVVEWSHTFEEPGRYLVICQVLPHFVEAKMYGWVIVQ